MLDIDDTMNLLYSAGVACEKASRRFPDPSLDYDYIRCFLDFHFDVRLHGENGIMFTTIRGGQMYTLSYVFTGIELDWRFAGYVFRELVDRFTNTVSSGRFINTI